MDFSGIYERKYLSWEDIEDWGAVERVATILGEGEVKQTKYGERAVILLQLAKDKKIKEYWLQFKDWDNLSKAYGIDSKEWIGKQVRMDPYVYTKDLTRIQLKPIDPLFATVEDIKSLKKEKKGV